MVNSFSSTNVTDISVADVFMALVSGTALDEHYEPARIGKISRLTTTQRDLYLDSILHPDSTVFSLGLSVKLPPTLDRFVWEQAIKIVCQTDDTIKTRFVFYQGEAFQFVNQNTEVNFEFMELTNSNFTSIEEIIEDNIKIKIDLQAGNLFKNLLVKDYEGNYTAVLGAPHILLDAYSGKVFFERVGNVYLELKAGNSDSGITENSIYDFFDEHLSRFDTEEIKNYWSEAFRTVIPVTSYLKTKKSAQPQSQKIQITGHELVAIREYCQVNNLSVPAFFRAVYGIYLSRYLQAPTDFVFYDIIGKRDEELLNSVGCIYQVVPVIVPQNQIDKNSSIASYLAYIRNYRRNLGTNQNISVLLQRNYLKDEQIKFFYNFYNFSVLDIPISDKFSQLTVHNSFAENEIHLVINDFTATLDIELFSNQKYFEDINFLNRLILIANQIIQGCKYFSKLNILLSWEEEQLEQWNNTHTEYERDKCIHQLFAEQVELFADTPAVVFPEAKVKEQSVLTYRELNQRANQLAYYLQDLGIKPDMPVGICVERNLEMMIGVLAILKAGATYVPMDPAYPKERLAFMMADTQVLALLTQQRLLTELPEHNARVICLDTDWEKISKYSQNNPVSEVTAENLAYIIYTSGSTGRPKGICLAHRPLVNLVQWHLNTLLTGARTLQFASLSFDASFHEMFATWLSGGTLFLVSENLRLDTPALTRFIHKHKIEKAILPVVVLQQMADIATSQLELLASFREITTTGEQLQITPAIVKLFKSLPNCTFHNHYGPSETHVVTALTLAGNPDFWPTYPSIGRPIANTQIYILDADLQPVPIGVTGELYIGGDSLARGYLHRPDLTEERFIPHPYSTSERLYKTGDLACYLPDGNIEYLGRIDQQVKIRGFRVELGEIESTLLQHCDVKEAAVIAREDIPGNRYLVAYIVANLPEKSHRIISGNLRSYLKKILPNYMIPSYFVVLAALPLTPNGKIDRRGLPEPDRTGRSGEADFISPRTAVEEVIANIWSEVLKIEHISVHDHFFEIGGHSLLATQVISRIRDNYQIHLPLRCLFDAPTVASLAAIVEEEIQQNLEWQNQSITPVNRNQNLPLSFAQQRLWFLEQLLPDNPFYNFPQSFHLFGQVNLTALEQSINEIVQRHEVLRTTFTSINGQPVQIIADSLTIPLHLIDLQSVSASEKNTEVQKLMLEEFQKPFSLKEGALLRAKLLQLEPQEYLLLLSIHHIVFDGWSVSVLFRELTQIYQAFTNNLPSPLTELSIQYADFAFWQKQWLQGKVLSEQIAYWQQQLADLPILQLPSDHPRPAVQTYRGARQTIAISKALSEELIQLSQKEGVTLFMTLLAAFQTLLYRYTSSEDILVGSLIANRHHQEIENLIGFFVNSLVLRSNFSGSPTFRDLLKQVREVTLQAYAHQDLPFEKLVEELEPERDLSRHPLFQICFALQNVPMQALELSGLTINHRLEHNGTAKFDLFLELFETSEGISGWFEYSTDLFDATTIARIGENYQTLLAGIVANPEQKVADLPILTAAERQQLLITWNQTQADYPEQSCIHKLFEIQAERLPDAVAVIFAQQQLTYQELNHKANQLAHHLQDLGVGAEVLVGICVERSLDMIVALLAILKAGGAYVPIDPAYPQQRLSLMLSDSQLSVLLTQEKLLGQLPEHQAQIVCLDRDWTNINNHSTDNLDVSVTPDNLAYVIYTSGSTGRPKGVQIMHRSVVNFLHFMGQHLQLTEDDRLLSVTTLSFDIAVLEIFLPLTLGARVVLVSREETFDGQELIAKLTNHNITIMQATPATWQLLLDAGWQGHQNLKILCGGEALPTQLASQLQQRCLTLWNVYGPTETTIWSATYQVESDEVVLIGRPIANTQFYVLDSQLQPVPVGVPGELYIGGAGLARGYIHRPDLTNERFIPHPYCPSQRLYKTGDLVRYLPDGNIEYLSRIDHQVKIRGFRIELGEIEAVLTQHPAVKTGVVIDREDVPGQKRLVAYLVQHQQQDNYTPEVSADWQTEHISQWQTLYDQTYKQTTEEQDKVFNIIGWNSSYTGLPIPSEEMREWVDCTVERILFLQPSQVLEIGCGTGLLLSRIIDRCSKYWGTDFAPEALRQIRQLRMSGKDWPQLTLLQRTADNFAGIEADAFDTVIINSVIQYFPSIDYLLEVLAGCVNAVRPGGSIFIGDVRSLTLLAAYHASVALYQASNSLSTVQLQERIRQRLNQEEELVIDPEFFQALKQHFPKISNVQIHVKHGQYHNELTKFRYDVVLNIGTGTDNPVNIHWLDWQKQELTLSSVRHLLLATHPEILGIKNVPNARVIQDITTLELLHQSDNFPTVAQVKEYLEQLPQTGIEPEELWNLSQDLPYHVDIIWSSVPEFYEVVFRNRNIKATTYYHAPVTIKPWHSYANQPLQSKFNRQLASELRHFLEQKLPDYMIPNAFVCLEKLPLTPNGKLDRLSLPAPDQVRTNQSASLITPRTSTESQMVALWVQVLGIDNVGIQDNFFELGGNSLLAAQLMMYVRESFQVELPVRCIFEQQTVEALSQVIDQLQQADSPILHSNINFQTEAVLDSSIYPPGNLTKDISQPKNVFVTGATGFLGAFLIYELLQQTQAKIYCHVRANDENEGFRRLKQTLEKYLIWDKNYQSRIIPVVGELSQPRLGLLEEKFEELAKQIDVIYHSGAQVNFAKPYSLIKAANVLGTQEILKLACLHEIKPVHYISTAAVFSTIASFIETKTLYEDDNIDESEPYLYYDIGYTQSKWVAEKLVWIAKSRGIPVTVIRSGFLMGHPQTGVTNTNDYISRLIKGCIQVGSFPELVNQKQDLITIDYASKAIVHLSRKTASLGKAFHIVPPPSQNIDLTELFDLVSAYGYKLEKLPFSEWTQKLINQARHSQENALFPLLPLLTEKVYEGLTALEIYQNTPDFDDRNTLEAISDTSITCLPINTELINTYLTHFVQSGFLHPPFIL